MLLTLVLQIKHHAKQKKIEPFDLGYIIYQNKNVLLDWKFTRYLLGTFFLDWSIEKMSNTYNKMNDEDFLFLKRFMKYRHETIIM